MSFVPELVIKQTFRGLYIWDFGYKISHLQLHSKTSKKEMSLVLCYTQILPIVTIKHSKIP